MEFEDMQIIWDSQNEQPLYGLNEAGLRAILRDKSRRFGRLVVWQEIQTFGATLFVISLCLFVLIAHYAQLEVSGISFELTGWDIAALLIAAGLWVPHTLGTYVKRKRQKQRERILTSSLQDELDLDIERTEDQIRTRKNLPLGYIPPHIGMALYVLVWLRITGTPVAVMLPVIVVQIIGLVWETRSQQRLVKQKMLPRKRELETLRNKLTDPSR